MMSRLIRYGASASVSIISKKLFPPPPRTSSFSSITTFKSMLSMLKSDCFSISDYNNLSSSLHKTGHENTNIELAQLWKEIITYTNVQVFPDIDTWKSQINSYCLTGKSGDISLAFSVFRRIINTGHCPTTSTLNDLFDGLCRRGLVYKAIMFYNYTVLKDFQLNPRTYSILIQGLCGIGETKLAIRLLREAMHIYKESIKEIRESNTQPAEQLLKKVVEGVDKEQRVDKEQKCAHITVRSWYELIILRLCRDGLLKEAHDLLSEMVILLACNTSAYVNLIHAYCINGQFKQAIASFKEWGKLLPVGYFRELPKNNSTLVTEQEVKAAKRAAAVLIKRGVRPDLAGFQSVRGGLFSGGRVKVARRVEDISFFFSVTAIFY